MKEKCKHDKVYSTMLLMSDPPQRPWICRICGEQGNDVVGEIATDEYSRLIKLYNHSNINKIYGKMAKKEVPKDEEQKSISDF